MEWEHQSKHEPRTLLQKEGEAASEQLLLVLLVPAVRLCRARRPNGEVFGEKGGEGRESLRALAHP